MTPPPAAATAAAAAAAILDGVLVLDEIAELGVATCICLPLNSFSVLIVMVYV